MLPVTGALRQQPLLKTTRSPCRVETAQDKFIIVGSTAGDEFGLVPSSGDFTRRRPASNGAVERRAGEHVGGHKPVSAVNGAVEDSGAEAAVKPSGEEEKPRKKKKGSKRKADGAADADPVATHEGASGRVPQAQHMLSQIVSPSAAALESSKGKKHKKQSTDKLPERSADANVGGAGPVEHAPGEIETKKKKKSKRACKLMTETPSESKNRRHRQHLLGAQATKVRIMGTHHRLR